MRVGLLGHPEHVQERMSRPIGMGHRVHEGDRAEEPRSRTAVTFPASWELSGVCFWFVWIGDRDGHDADIFRVLTLLSIWMCQPT